MWKKNIEPVQYVYVRLFSLDVLERLHERVCVRKQTGWDIYWDWGDGVRWQ